jgi:hypothetical protein
MTLVLWAAVALALAAPSIKSGVFDAMSTDDAIGGRHVHFFVGGVGAPANPPETVAKISCQPV